MNRVEKLIDEYANKWRELIPKPEPLSDEDLVSGNLYYDKKTHSPSLIMQRLWENRDYSKEKHQWELECLKDVNITKYFIPEFIKDTIKYIKSMEEIPEHERFEFLSIIEKEFSQPITRNI